MRRPHCEQKARGSGIGHHSKVVCVRSESGDEITTSGSEQCAFGSVEGRVAGSANCEASPGLAEVGKPIELADTIGSAQWAAWVEVEVSIAVHSDTSESIAVAA